MNLSPREREVIALYCRGWSGPALGEKLGMSQFTAQTYLARIKKKLNAKNLVHAAVIWATRKTNAQEECTS